MLLVPRRGRRMALAAAAVALAAAGAVLAAPPTGGQGTVEAKLKDKPVTKTWRVLDAKGRRAGKAAWRVTTAGGNCCEVLIAATAKGRLVEWGGTYPAYSDNAGRSWTEVQTPVPPSSRLVPPQSPRGLGGGEGTVVMAPGGDIVGVTWDPYNGDRLQSFIYKASDKKWYFQEAPLHEPFYDREWVAVAKGPFTIGGQRVPWVSLVLSNFHRRAVLMSLDGLNYFTPAQRDIDALRPPAVEKYLRVVKDPDMDYMQEHSETGVVALAGGGALSLDNAGTCETQILRTDLSWGCFSLPDAAPIEGRLHVDSRGWLHNVAIDGDTVEYRVSTNGGRTWSSTEMLLPLDAIVGGNESWDFKAHGKLGLTAIAVHALVEGPDGSPAHQDMVLRVDTKKAKPRHRDTLLVGDGNFHFTSGLDVSTDKSNRVDFATVAILPNGKIAVGFADKTYDDPALAILI